MKCRFTNAAGIRSLLRASFFTVQENKGDGNHLENQSADEMSLYERGGDPQLAQSEFLPSHAGQKYICTNEQTYATMPLANQRARSLKTQSKNAHRPRTRRCRMCVKSRAIRA
jgi:hypothetical protein